MIAEAQAELDELEVAERVLERLSNDQDDDQDDVSQGRGRTREPTIADMAVKFLSEAGPLTTTELLEQMRANWRDDLGDTTLTSTLSRTKNAGRIAYSDGKWIATNANGLNENEVSAEASEANAGGASDTPGVQTPIKMPPWQ
jgi:hypothetical protein